MKSMAWMDLPSQGLTQANCDVAMVAKKKYTLSKNLYMLQADQSMVGPEKAIDFFFLLMGKNKPSFIPPPPHFFSPAALAFFPPPLVILAAARGEKN